MKIIQSHYIAVLISTAIFFVGCAVLTVDVDVYKGPLANHRNVQIEQMAAMAIGAKPLLVELRDSLEAKGPTGRRLENADAADFRERANKECWYKPAYIGPAPDETKSRFRNQNADRVNEILSLYEDLERDEQYSLFVGRAREALKDYKKAYEIMGPESIEADEQLWQKIEPKEDSFKDEAVRLIDSKDKKNINMLAAEIKKLRNNYKELYTKEDRNARPLFASWNKIRDQLNISQTEDLKALQNDPLLKDKDEELRANANAQFLALAKTSLVDYHAEYLFGLKGKQKDIFVDHVKKISWAFLDARDALERLWRAEMEAIIWLSDKSQETVFRSDPRIIDIAKASLEVIQPRYVAILIEHKDDIKHYMPKETEYLIELLTELTVSGLAVKGYKWDDSSYESAKKILESAFDSEPAKMAKALLASHKFCRLRLKPKDFGEKIHKEAGHLGYISGWHYGLVRAPFAPGDTPLAMTTLTTSVEGAFPHGAFGKGRLDDGLETLIEKYLRLADVCNPNDEELQRVCKQLSDALVRFAEKVLFVANNNSLISPPKETGLIPGIYDVVVRSIFGWELQDKLSKGFDYNLPDTHTKSYTRVLQAVGNSILVQVDALRHEDEYEKNSEDRIESEIYAINRVLARSQSDVIDRLLQSLRAEEAAKTREIEKAQSELSIAKEKLDEANKDLEETNKRIRNIVPQNDETFVEAAERQQEKVISAHLLLVSQKPGDQTVQAARKLATEAQQAVLDIKPEPNSPKEFALELAKELANKAKSAAVPNINDWLSNAGTYFNDKAVDFSQDKCIDANKAYEKIINEMEKEYLTVDLLIDLAGKADKAKESADNQNKIVEDINKSTDKAKGEKTKVEHAISAIAEAKYDVLRKADEAKAGSKITAQFLIELLKVTLEESRDKAVDAQKPKFQNAIAVLSDQPPPIEPVIFDRSKLSDKPTAKEVRDLWITVLEYEHDLALRDGQKSRANEIMEAIKAARKKREGMIFIRPAMAYLRTSFPATSLQDNPNLTWDNMLGGHMMRSIPFGPQLRDLLDPETKRDAQINAEIDKQFWQNINRVRVAGGGNTNYAVVKDDIGNWYVKGYSADPCDIIDSARNLGMFSLSEKLNTDLLGRINRDEEDLPSEDKSDANQTAIERMYNKYTEQYNSRISADRERLTDILENEMKSAIVQAWQRNEELKEDDVPKLENKLETAIELHLKNPTDELKETGDITEQGSKIISTLQAIRRFHKILLTDIHNTITVPKGEKFLKAKEEKALKEQELSNAKEKGEEVTEKEEAFKTAKGNYETAITEYDAAIRVEECSIRDVTRIIREKIMAIIISRMDSVQDYETALMFIGESNTQ